MSEHDHKEAEINDALRVPAHVSNRVAVLWGDRNVRIIFGDKPATDKATNFSVHVALDHADATTLIDVLARMKAQHEANTAIKN